MCTKGMVIEENYSMNCVAKYFTILNLLDKIRLSLISLMKNID